MKADFQEAPTCTSTFSRLISVYVICIFLKKALNYKHLKTSIKTSSKPRWCHGANFTGTEYSTF